MKLTVMTCVLLLAACGAGPAGKTSLVTLTTEAPGTNCPDGGTVINAGVDENGNGTLDAGEITSTQYACKGDTGATGNAGAMGTTGAKGATGTTSPQPLIRTEPEPEGTNCTYGGTKIETGIDANGDGVLEDDEVDASATTYACNPPSIADLFATASNVVIDSDFVGSLIDSVTVLHGNLRITGTTTSVSLPNLTQIGGTLTVASASLLTALSLPALTSVGSDVSIDGFSGPTLDLSAIATIAGGFSVTNSTTTAPLSFPVLTTVGGDLTVDGATGTTTLSFPALTSVTGNITVADNNSLTTESYPVLTTIGGVFTTYDINGVIALDFPALTHADGISIDLYALTSLTLPKLTSLPGVVGLSLSDANAVVTLSAPMLATAGYLYVNSAQVATLSFPVLTSVTGDAHLVALGSTTVSFPVLTTVGGDYYMCFNTVLTAFVAPLLTSIPSGDVSIYVNPALRQCVVDGVVAQLSPAPGNLQTYNNNGGPNTCP